MRLWSLHPQYLDARGLVALWREALLAQAVLAGRTRGYANHPQLTRFRAQPSPEGAIADYLRAIHAEAVRRGYRFDAGRIGLHHAAGRLAVTCGQMGFERRHLLAKLAARDPERGKILSGVGRPKPHPLFRVVAGGVEPWEKGG